MSNISFYRLRAYTYPYQDNNDPKHPFTSKISFEEIIQLYVFDRQLRLFILDSIEKIEVSVRTRMIYEFSMKHDSQWFCTDSLFKDADKLTKHLEEIQGELDRSKEDFIQHYNNKYDMSEYPPSWMTLEVVSFGVLSKLYENTNNTCGTKRQLALNYGLKNEKVLENWLQRFSIIRNICAHHSRVWNKRLSPIELPNKPLFEFPNMHNVLVYKLYAYLVCIKYILNIINPTNSFSERLRALFKKYPIANPKEMGFPKNWESLPFWQ